LYSNISALYIQCFEQPQYYGLKHAIPQHPQGKKKYPNLTSGYSNGTHIC